MIELRWKGVPTLDVFDMVFSDCGREVLQFREVTMVDEYVSSGDGYACKQPVTKYGEWQTVSHVTLTQEELDIANHKIGPRP